MQLQHFSKDSVLNTRKHIRHINLKYFVWWTIAVCVPALGWLLNNFPIFRYDGSTYSSGCRDSGSFDGDFAATRVQVRDRTLWRCRKPSSHQGVQRSLLYGSRSASTRELFGKNAKPSA